MSANVKCIKIASESPAIERTLSNGIRTKRAFHPGASGSLPPLSSEGGRQFLFTSNMWHDDVKRATEGAAEGAA